MPRLATVNVSYGKKWNEPLIGAAGAGTGLFASELLAEYTAIVTGQEGYWKAGTKTLVKGTLGLLTYAVGLMYPFAGIFLIPFTLSTWGSTALDWFSAYYAGGVGGLAQYLSSITRIWSVGRETVERELQKLSEKVEVKVVETGQVQTIRTSGAAMIKEITA